MKTILSIPIPWFFVAVILGIALPILLSSSVFAPTPIETPIREITPVPTPKEVYVEQPTAAQPTTDTDGMDDNPLHIGLFAVLFLSVNFVIMTFFRLIYSDQGCR